MPAAKGTERPPHQLFLESGPLIDGIVRTTCRRHRLTSEEAQDFRQEVHLHLVQDNYRALRAWNGSCDLKVYLATIVRGLMQDYKEGRADRTDSPGLSAQLDSVLSRQLYLESGALIDEVIRFASRRFRFSREDAQDFRQQVHLKLIQDDYRVLRVWNRKSTLKSFIAAVIFNFGRDYMDQRLGRFRSSAIAIKLGKVAVLLEMLLFRDGLSDHHAKAVLRSRHGVTLSDAELDALRAQIPDREKLQLVDIADIQEPTAQGKAPEGVLFAKRMRELRKRVYPILADAMKERSAREQMLLKLHFLEGFKISEIALAWKEKQKPFYRELERIFRALRKHLEAQGFSRGDVEDLLREMGEDPEDDGQPEGESLWLS